MRRPYTISPGGSDPLSGGTNDNVELLIAWAGTSLAFALFMASGQIGTEVVRYLAMAAITCGIGFVLHELAHRILARNYGAEAHFIADKRWLMLSVLIAFAGVFIAAPGAVWHRGNLTKQQSGLIALAGPVTNLVLALVFLAMLFLILPLFPVSSFWAQTIWVGYMINAWLGMFNMIPFGPFDGAKVFNWNQLVFGITIAIAIVLALVLPRMI